MLRQTQAGPCGNGFRAGRRDVPCSESARRGDVKSLGVRFLISERGLVESVQPDQVNLFGEEFAINMGGSDTDCDLLP